MIRILFYKMILKIFLKHKNFLKDQLDLKLMNF